MAYPRYVIADRRDLLGGRMVPVLNAMRLARHWDAVVAAGERDGVQGLLAWIALPGLVLRPGEYSLVPSSAQSLQPDRGRYPQAGASDDPVLRPVF